MIMIFRLFQEDVKQVLDWLTNHGEVFIRKNTGVGRNLQKARVYQKSHEHFENVAQVILYITVIIIILPQYNNHILRILTKSVLMNIFVIYRILILMRPNC